MRIWVTLCHILWKLHGINGVKYCSSDKPVIHVCRNSTGNNQDNIAEGVYVSTANVPILADNVCRCTILPTTMNTIELNIQGDANMPTVDFMIEINNVTINNLPDLSKAGITGETELVYSSSIDFKGGFCLSIAPTSSDRIFSMTCVPNQNEVVNTTEATISSRSNITDTTSSSGHSTDTTSSSGHNTNTTSSSSHSTYTTTQQTVSKMQTKPSNDANHVSETNITLIAIISGSVGGVALIAVVIISIVCCKRKRKPEITEATAPNEPECNNDNAYGMVTNPAYEHFSEVMPMKTVASEDHDTKADITSIDSSSHYYSTPIKTDNNRVHIQKIQHDEDDTYDHTATSNSGNWTGNEYKRHSINQNGNNCDNENYSVLNPK